MPLDQVVSLLPFPVVPPTAPHGPTPSRRPLPRLTTPLTHPHPHPSGGLCLSGRRDAAAAARGAHRRPARAGRLQPLGGGRARQPPGSGLRAARLLGLGGAAVRPRRRLRGARAAGERLEQGGAPTAGSHQVAHPRAGTRTRTRIWTWAWTWVCMHVHVYPCAYSTCMHMHTHAGHHRTAQEGHPLRRPTRCTPRSSCVCTAAVARAWPTAPTRRSWPT